MLINHRLAGLSRRLLIVVLFALVATLISNPLGAGPVRRLHDQ